MERALEPRARETGRRPVEGADEKREKEWTLLSFELRVMSYEFLPPRITHNS